MKVSQIMEFEFRDKTNHFFTEAMKVKATKKLQKLTKFSFIDDDTTIVQIEIQSHKDKTVHVAILVNVKGHGHLLKTNVEAENYYKALDLSVHNLLTQAEKWKQKHHNSHRDKLSVAIDKVLSEKE